MQKFEVLLNKEPDRTLLHWSQEVGTLCRVYVSFFTDLIVTNDLGIMFLY